VNKDVRITLKWLARTKALPEEAIEWLKGRTLNSKAFRDEVRWLLTDVQWAELLGELRCARLEQQLINAKAETRQALKERNDARAEARAMKYDPIWPRQAPSALPPDMAKVIRMLVHPDKHNGSQASVKAFKYINEIVQR
jgi:hypothetical protein